MSNSKTRVYNEVKDLDYSNIKKFFDQRKEKIGELQPINLVLYQDQQPELAKQRDEHEKKIIIDYLQTFNKKFKILDVGCGIGRWGFHLLDFTEDYLGFDFAEDFINIASEEKQRNNISNLNFQVLSAVDFKIEELMVQPPFSLIIISGVLAYLNDRDVSILLGKLKTIMDNDGMIYIREPMGRENRLTLNNHYSNDMEMNYSAVYRTINEYKKIIEDVNNESEIDKFHTVKEFDLYPESLNNRKETIIHVIILGKH